MNIYLIKDLSRKTGFSIHTIKYYYKLNLIKEVGRSPYTNFRYFDDGSIARLNEVKRLRKLHLSLSDIKKQLQGKGRFK